MEAHGPTAPPAVACALGPGRTAIVTDHEDVVAITRRRSRPSRRGRRPSPWGPAARRRAGRGVPGEGGRELGLIEPGIPATLVLAGKFAGSGRMQSLPGGGRLRKGFNSEEQLADVAIPRRAGMASTCWCCSSPAQGRLRTSNTELLVTTPAPCSPMSPLVSAICRQQIEPDHRQRYNSGRADSSSAW